MLVAACLLASAPLLAFGAGSAAPLPGSDPDAALGAVFKDIERGRLPDALEKVDSLIQRYPNFRLAHLIRGDLLLARSRPLPLAVKTAFAWIKDAPPGADAAAEARATEAARKAYEGDDYTPGERDSSAYLQRAWPDFAAMASGGMDTLPHNGAVITLLAVTGLTHRQSYKDIFAITVIKTAAVFFVIAMYYATGLV